MWDRDINAARNIPLIGVREIMTGSRPPEFQRGTQTQDEPRIARRKRHSPESLRLAHLKDMLAHNQNEPQHFSIAELQNLLHEKDTHTTTHKIDTNNEFNNRNRLRMRINEITHIFFVQFSFIPIVEMHLGRRDVQPILHRASALSCCY